MSDRPKVWNSTSSRNVAANKCDNVSSYDMYKDIDEVLSQKRGMPFLDKFIRGLPIGLKLSNGITIGQ